MTTTFPSTSITFAVDDVTPTNKTFSRVNLLTALTEGMGRGKPVEPSDHSWTHPVQSPYRVIGLRAHTEEVIAMKTYNSRPHPLLEAVHLAFANHLPLTFSPDMIWQTVVQGVAQHINMLPEAHRKQFVMFEGKQTLTLERPDLSLANLDEVGAALESIAEGFTSLLGTQVTPAYLKAFQSTFSTTSPIEATAARIACMDAFSPFFTYQMICGCGFPSITLTGTPTDWRALKAKIIEIEELFHLGETNLTWWTEKLRVVLDHFISAAEGQPDTNWWKRMYKQIDVYLSSSFNGWIGWLWPYVQTTDQWDGERWVKPASSWQRNPMLEDISDRVTIWESASFITPKAGQQIDEVTLGDSNQRYLSLNMGQSFKGSCFLGTDVFPLGLSQVNLKIVDLLAGKSLDTVLVGGFVGTIQEPNGGLVPQLGYALLV